jgi:hypothetical protein
VIGVRAQNSIPSALCQGLAACVTTVPLDGATVYPLPHHPSTRTPQATCTGSLEAPSVAGDPGGAQQEPRPGADSQDPLTAALQGVPLPPRPPGQPRGDPGRSHLHQLEEAPPGTPGPTTGPQPATTGGRGTRTGQQPPRQPHPLTESDLEVAPATKPTDAEPLEASVSYRPGALRDEQVFGMFVR